MLFRDGFTATGVVHIERSRIDGELSLDGARLAPTGVALALLGSEVGELNLGLAEPGDALVDLRHSHCAVLRDHPRTWPTRVALDGFTYDAFARPRSDDRPVSDVTARLEWLGRDIDGYRPQPYEQLAGLYRRLGDDDDARRVLLHKERRRRPTQSLGARLVGHGLDWLVGYGYRPWRAAVWLLVMLALGTATFARWPPDLDPSAAPRPFDPFVYTVDLLVPISAFGLREDFVAVGPTRWLAYALTAAGWLLVTALIAGISRALRRD
jgi:hypothetical protein